MKKLLSLLVLLCLEKALHAQFIYTIKADSVKITNSCDTAELMIENHTQTVPGFSFREAADPLFPENLLLQPVASIINMRDLKNFIPTDDHPSATIYQTIAPMVVNKHNIW